EDLRMGNLKGGVVGTLMSNMGLELAFKKLGIPFVRAEVGDRYVIKEMHKKGWILGAENSGHVILLEKTTTGDGIIAGLQILTIMVRNHMTLYDLCSGIKMFPQILLNVDVNSTSSTLNNHDIKIIAAKIEKELIGFGRVILRKSGTEPLIRVMVEGENKLQVIAAANRIIEQINKIDNKVM
ncbi:MAG: phosphoglucosamine mutase, partial [Pantoea sp. Brub]|nr:phosphoglucosamine mutase [Pantoea sp. Brub]